MKQTLLLIWFVILCAIGAEAQVPELINYQGRVTVGTTNFNSPPNGQFRFALVNTNGTTSYWSNDGTSCRAVPDRRMRSADGDARVFTPSCSATRASRT